MSMGNYLVDENTMHVGTLFLHPGSRRNLNPPAANVEAFKDANPKHPIITNETTQAEEGQEVLAHFVF